MLSPWLERDTPQTLAYLFLSLSFKSDHGFPQPHHHSAGRPASDTNTQPIRDYASPTSNFCLEWVSLSRPHVLSQPSLSILNNLRNEIVSRDHDVTCTIDTGHFGLTASYENHSTQLRSRVVCRQMFPFCCCSGRPRLDQVSGSSADPP